MNAGRAGWLDNDEFGTVRSEHDGEMSGEGCRQPADAGLHENMRRPLRQRFQHLAEHGGITLHDQRGDALIAWP
jgi:hypothetical protein